jgi:hypothetical protein
VTKECREKILRLKTIYFDEFRGPLKRAKNQNFKKQKIAFFSHVPMSIMSKN